MLDVKILIEYKLDSLSIKTEMIVIPWSNFSIVTGGSVISRYAVEALVQLPIHLKNIITINAVDSNGYFEYAIVTSDKKYMRCGQILNNTFHNTKDGYMTVEIIYL